MALAGARFFLSTRLPMEEHKTLGRLIPEHGGELVEKPGDPKCYHVLPLFTQPDVEAELRQYQKERLPVIGPPCVREATEKVLPLPSIEEVQRGPLYCRIMRSAIVCSTGIIADARDVLVQRVKYMGGSWHMDFTNTVTHMLATGPGTQKYKVAVQRGRPALVLPNWVTECWRQQTLLPIKDFAVPPFAGLIITVTGLPREQRKKIAKLCVEHGGEYSKDLNKDCTHLVVERPGSKKHQYALMWGTVVVVHPKWLYDSVEQKVCLDERNYPPISVDTDSMSPSSMAESSGTVDSQSQHSERGEEAGNGKGLRRSHSPSAISQLADNAAKRQRTTKKENSDDGEEVKSSQPFLTVNRQSRTTQSTTTQNSPYTLCSRDTMVGDGVLQVGGFSAGSHMDTDTLLASLPPLSYSPYESPSLFKGISFFCKGFDSESERRMIRKLLEEHGGTVLFGNRNEAVSPAEGTYVLYVLAPHGTPGVTPLEGPSPTDIMVTPQWVQRCIQAEKVLNPMDMPALFQPLPHPLPLPKPPLDYLISVSGFAGEERDNIKALIEALGFQHSERFSKKNTHLICKEPGGPKFDKAREWKTGAIVKVDWLVQSALRGKIQDTKRYISVQDDDILAATKKFEERQRNQAKANKRGREKVIVIPEPKATKETRSTKRRSSASTSTTTTATSRTVKAEPSEPFLSDVTILVCKKLEQKQSMLHDLVASMGGSFAYMFDPSITHLVFEGRADASKELRLAKAHRHIKIVSPMWLEACKKSNRKVDESEYPHTMNPRMTLGLDFKAPIHAVKKEKRDADYDAGALRSSQPAGGLKREPRDEDEDTSSFTPFYGGFSQSQQPHLIHHEERDEDFFVPPTQQPDSQAGLLSLGFSHQLRPPQPQYQQPPERSERRRSREEESEEGQLLRKKRGRAERFDETSTKVSEPIGEDPYDVVVGCTPDVRRETVTEGLAMTVATTSAQTYFWQVKEEQATDGKSEETVDRVEDGSDEEEETKEEEEESEGSGHSAIIQQLLQKRKPAPTNGQLRIPPLIRMQPAMKTSIMESITRNVVRSEARFGKDLNRSLTKFPTAIFKPPMTKELLSSQAEEDDHSQSSQSMRRFHEEPPESQVVKYAYPVEQEAQDLLFSLAEESMDTEAGTSAAESASERDRGMDHGRSKRKATAGGDESKADLRAEPKKRRRSVPEEAEDDASNGKEADDKSEKEENNSHPWNSRGSDTSSSRLASALSFEKSLMGKPYVFMFTAFTATKPIAAGHLDIVRQLGGHVLEAKFFSRACTHVVMAEPTRTEKSLAACAAGIWLLKASYLNECIEKNAFVDEMNHVWTENDVSNEQSQQMIAANRRWRAEVSKRRAELQQAGKKGEELQRVGAYSGWRVLLIHTEVKRGEGLKRLIEAGGGEVFSPNSVQPQTLTHAFFNEKPDESNELVTMLRRAKVPLVATEYIGDHLTQHPQPNLDRYNFFSSAFSCRGRSRGTATIPSAATNSSTVESAGGAGGGASSVNLANVKVVSRNVSRVSSSRKDK